MTPIIVGGIVGTTWSTWRRKAVTICSLIAAVTGAIVGVAKAAPIVEPWWYAHRGYVREYNHEMTGPLLQRIIEIQLDNNSSKRDRLLKEVPTRELELQSDQAKQNPQYKDLVQQRVDRVKKELKTLDEQDKSLFNEKLSK
jgi:hypothetical protein